MKEKRKILISGVGLSVLLIMMLTGTAVVFGYGYGYGYGYNCEGGYGYGYSCEGSGSEGDSSVVTVEKQPKASVVREYREYKKKYKKRNIKARYREVKKWKKGTPEEKAKYFEYRGWYYQYKHLSRNEREKYLTPEIYDKVKEYKRYKGYKKYKKLRQKLGK